MGYLSKSAVERNERRSSTDVEVIAQVIAAEERRSYASTELAHTDALGLVKRQDVASRLGQAMSHASIDFMREVEKQCQTPQELAIGVLFAQKFLDASEAAFAEYMADHMRRGV